MLKDILQIIITFIKNNIGIFFMGLYFLIFQGLYGFGLFLL